MPLCGALLLFLIGRRDRYAVFAVMYAAIATIGGLVFSSGAGVDANAMFDADIALVLCAGLLLDRLEYQPSGVVAAFLYIAPLAILLKGSAPDWTRGDYWLHPLAEDRLTAAAAIGSLRTAPDPVICEMLSLCYWAGREAQV